MFASTRMGTFLENGTWTLKTKEENLAYQGGACADSSEGKLYKSYMCVEGEWIESPYEIEKEICIPEKEGEIFTYWVKGEKYGYAVFAKCNGKFWQRNDEVELRCDKETAQVGDTCEFYPTVGFYAGGWKMKSYVLSEDRSWELLKEDDSEVSKKEE